MPMNVWVMDNVDLGDMDRLMYDSQGRLRAVPADVLHSAFPLTTIQAWCVHRGVYQVPTQELIDWLRSEIVGNAIETNAGFGVIGRLLGIPRTDSYMQTRPEIIAYYETLRQATINPPADVQRLTANEAVTVFKPDTVIAAWATQLYRDGDVDGSVEGVDEEAILPAVKKYIHIGNDGPHGSKRINRLPHKQYRFPWLISRGRDQSANVIRVWHATPS